MHTRTYRFKCRNASRTPLRGYLTRRVGDEYFFARRINVTSKRSRHFRGNSTRYFSRKKILAFFDRFRRVKRDKTLSANAAYVVYVRTLFEFEQRSRAKRNAFTENTNYHSDNSSVFPRMYDNTYEQFTINVFGESKPHQFVYSV